jgi:hypothetical protein
LTEADCEETIDPCLEMRRDISTSEGALLRLAGSVLVEAHDEWQAGERRHLSEGSMTLLATPAPDPKEVATPALLKA